MNMLNLEGAVEITMDRAVAIMNGAGGRFFRVDFVKRGNGALRCMVARTGVKPANPAGGPTVDAGMHGCIRVWEPPLFASDSHDPRAHDSRYRMISLERLRGLKFQGVTYRVAS